MQIDLRALDVEQSDRLGLAFPASDISTYAELADAGIGRVRLGVSWDLIEPENGSFNWSGLDQRINTLVSLGIEPLLTFYTDAAWGVTDSPNTAKNQMPADMAEWQEFVAAVAARYGDVVTEYQFGNEFIGANSASGGWSDTPEAFVETVNATYDAVKAADPGSVFVMGGISSFVSDIALVNFGYADFDPSQDWSATSATSFSVAEARSDAMDTMVDRWLTQIYGAASYDAVAVHLYGDTSRNPLRVEMMADLTGRPVVVTESGAPNHDGDQPTAEEFFVSAVMSDLGALAGGAESVFWFSDFVTEATTYAVQDVSLRDEAGTPKGSFWAKKLLAVYLTDDATVDSPADGVFEVTDPQGEQALFGLAGDVLGLGLAGGEAGDVWVVEDPSTGLLRRLEPGERVDADEFIILDTGWLADAASGETEPSVTGAVGLTFGLSEGGATRVEIALDESVIEVLNLPGVTRFEREVLTDLGIAVGAEADGRAQVRLHDGLLGIASAGEAGAARGEIDGDERLVLEFAPTRLGDTPEIRIGVAPGSDGDRARLDAFFQGELVFSQSVEVVDGMAEFTPGRVVDRVEISAEADDAFALNSVDLTWYDYG